MSDGGSQEDAPRTRGRRRSRTFNEEELTAELGGAPVPIPSSGSGRPSSGGSSSSGGADSVHGSPSRKGVPVSDKTRDILELKDYRMEAGTAVSGSESEEDEELRRLERAEAAARAAGAVPAPVAHPAAAGGGDGGVASDAPPIKLKLLLLGDGGVGKTSLLQRYSKDRFDPDMLATAGVAFQTEHLTIAGRRVRCDIWDTAGQERFHVITRAYYAKSHGIVLVYDVSERDEVSFQNIQYWMDNIRRHASANVARVLIGNKIDKKSDFRVATERGAAAAKEYGMPFFETSAKTGTNVTEAFYTVAEEALRRVLEERGEDVEAHLGNQDTATEGKRRRCTIM